MIIYVYKYVYIFIKKIKLRKQLIIEIKVVFL